MIVQMPNTNRKTIVRTLNESAACIDSYGVLSTLRCDSFNRCDDAFNAAAIDAGCEVLVLVVGLVDRLVSFMSISGSFMVSLDGAWLGALPRFGRLLRAACIDKISFQQRIWCTCVGNSVHEQWAHESGMKQKSGLMTTTRTMAANKQRDEKTQSKWAPSCLAVSHYMQCVCVCALGVAYCAGWMCDIYGHRWCWCATWFEYKGVCRLLHLFYSLFTFRNMPYARLICV